MPLTAETAVVIEDDEDIRNLIALVLEQAGYTVHTAGNGPDGLALVAAHQPVVATVDVNMPGMDGFEAAERIRAISPAYVVMITARTDEIDTVQGLQSGADDYVTKPFRPRELRARIEAMRRRPRMPVAAATVDVPPTGAPAPDVPTASPASAAPPAPSGSQAGHAEPGWLTHHDLRVHPEMRLVERDGERVDLTRSEFDLLAHLVRAGRRVCRKAELVLALRGDDNLGADAYVSAQDTRAIEVHVANLRRKLGESPTAPRWIETIRGVGYRLTA